MLNKHEVLMLMDSIYRGAVNLKHLPSDFYLRTAKGLEDELNKGCGEIKTDAQRKLYYDLRNNLYYFSAAKTFQFVYATMPEKSEAPEKYTERIGGIVGLFIGSYFSSEKETTFYSSKQAKKWTKFVQRKTAPYLEYVTMKDNRVRPAHAYLDGIIRIESDPFWKTFYPPNGWACRCKVKSTPKGEGTHMEDFNLDEALKNVPPSFRNNSGQTGKVFNNKHPYFNVPKDFKDQARNNFGLPLPHNHK